MTSPFKFNSTDFGPEQEGLVLHCFASQSDYFTQGEKYKVFYDVTGAYLISDCGMQIGQSSSMFMLPLPLTPKQPKAGEVWAIRSSAFTDNSLYWIDRVEAGLVYNRHIRGGARHCESLERFLEQHTFVF